MVIEDTRKFLNALIKKEEIKDFAIEGAISSRIIRRVI